MMQQLVTELRSKLDAVKKGGGEAAVRRHKERGKMFVRERITAVIDPNTPFLEFSALAANGMYDDEAPSAGIVTGIGVIQGHRTVIVANDATVKGGTYFPVTVKKHLRAQLIREPDVIRVKKRDVVSAGSSNAAIACRAGSSMAGMQHQ
mgnify:CR=1 FL=1